MDVRVLGPFQVTVAGRPATPAGRAERELLAFLAMQPGRLVPSERIIDAIWGERLPANPANALQLRVSKLRRALVAAGGSSDAVTTEPPGYRLDLPTDAVDAARFKAAVVRARALSEAHDHHGALEFYRRAASEWHGPALVGLGEAAWVTEEAQQLESLRLTATEERLALELEIGRHAEVLEDVEALVAEEPLRERLHGLRMLALYRCGRQADALEAFQQVKQVLDQELGLDPSPELRGLETAILRHDPQLLAPEQAPGPTRMSPNLPAPRAAILGRDVEVEELVELAGRHRLVTVTGPGGAGKTTIATEVARRLADRHAEGAWFVPLAEVSDPGDLVAAVAGVFGLPPAEALPGESSHDRLARQLSTRDALVVLDNCEHLVDAAAALVDRLLSACPHLTVLATSREALATAGEVQYSLPPLAVPDVEASTDELRTSPAVALFSERARAVDHRFEPGPEQVRTIAAICRALDGMPLAIELAAARAKTLPVEEIAARLDDRFQLLTTGNRTAEERHRTLRATIAWSHQLLDGDERVLLRRLAVLRGTFDLATAERVAADPTLDAGAVIDVLAQLVDRSLVTRVEAGHFRLLETVRQFAEEELRAAGEHEATHARNLDRLLGLTARAVPELRGRHQRRWLGVLRDAQDDLRAALAFCADRPAEHGRSGLRLAASLGWFWYLGDHEEGRRQLHRMLEVCDLAADPHGHALALEALSLVERPSACLVHPSTPCADAARAAIPLFEAGGDREGAARARLLLAVEGARGTGTEDAIALLDVAEGELSGHPWELALASFVRMEVLLRSPVGPAALAHGEEAVGRFEQLGDLWGVSSVLGHLGHNRYRLGQLDEALASSRRALAIARDTGLVNSVQLMGFEVGLQLLQLGDEDGAERELLASRTVAQRYGYPVGDAMGAVGQAQLARRHGDLARAEELLEHALEVLSGVGFTLYLVPVYSGLGYLRELQSRFDEAESAHRQVLAIAQQAPDPWIVATAWEGLGAVAAARGDGSRAVRLLAAAADQRARSDRPLTPLDREEVERATSTARRLIGDAAVEAAFATGAAGTACLDERDLVRVS